MRVTVGWFVAAAASLAAPRGVAAAGADAGGEALAASKQAAAALRKDLDAAWRKNDYEKAAEVLTRLLEPQHINTLGDWERADCRIRYGECLVRLKKPAAAVEFYLAQEKAEKDPRRSQQYAMLAGDAARGGQLYDQALGAYERVFVEHAGLSDHWSATQHAIVETLMKKGDFAGALKAAAVCLDAAFDSRTLEEAVHAVAEAFRAVDRHVGRANAFINFQRHGPAGPDGKVGTDDDLANPLPAVGYPSCPQRDAALAKARVEAGDDAWASRHRAQTFIYTGKPREALRMYLDAFARCSTGELERYGRELVVVGVRAVQGHPNDLERFFTFLNYGPAGPDGKPGTADDLADPFLSLGLKASELAVDGPGGAEPSDQAVADLRRAREVLKAVATSPAESQEVRRSAVLGLLRASQALNEWPDGPGWFIDRLQREKDPRSAGLWIAGAERAARGADRHIGALRSFWQDVDALGLFQGPKDPREAEGLRKGFQRAAGAFEKASVPLVRNVRPARLTGAKLDLSRLRPYPEAAR